MIDTKDNITPEAELALNTLRWSMSSSSMHSVKFKQQIPKALVGWSDLQFQIITDLYHVRNRRDSLTWAQSRSWMMRWREFSASRHMWQPSPSNAMLVSRTKMLPLIWRSWTEDALKARSNLRSLLSSILKYLFKIRQTRLKPASFNSEKFF